MQTDKRATKELMGEQPPSMDTVKLLGGCDTNTKVGAFDQNSEKPYENNYAQADGQLFTLRN